MATAEDKGKKIGKNTNRRNLWLLIVTTVLMVISVVLFMPPDQKINQGLDVQGGLSVVLTASSTTGEAITDEDMETSRAIIESRVNALGASEAVVQVQGTNQILVQIPGLSDTQTALDTIGKTGKLEFARLDSFTDEEVKSAIESGNYGDQSTLTDDYGNTFVNTDAEGLKVEEGTYTPMVTGENIERVNVGRESETSTYYAVNIDLDSPGTQAFAEASRDLVSDRGQIVIILDGEVQSAPAVQSEIPNGNVSITGNYTLEQAQALETVLESGSLPVSFQYSQSQVVGPTLGQDALRTGVLVAIIGLLLVMLYLIFFYKGLGLLTAGAVIVFAVLYLGILAALSAFHLFSLTLAGIAGIVLTIGMAADSSVLTVERFREEIRMGKSVKAASISGVKHGILTSIDADLVSLVSALCLFFLASASVKGFGLTLSIGIICDIVMMLLFKAPIIRLLAPRVMAKHPGFWNIKDGQIAAKKYADLGAVLGVSAGDADLGEQLDCKKVDAEAEARGGAAGLKVAESVHNLKGRFIKHDINFMGARKVFLSISAVLVVLAIGFLGFRGLNLGIEFVGGTSITFHDTGDLTLEELRGAFADAGQPEVTLQTTSSDGQEGFLARMAVTDAQEATEIANGIADDFDLTTENFEVTTIGPDWGSSVINQSLLAFIVSLALIIIYIGIRFEFKMGVVAVVVLLHDLLIVVGIYALVGREFTPNAVAALLTIIGYSLYDTVVVFHRITDNAKSLDLKCSFYTMANLSLNQVFIRSINTTVTSTIPVLAMLLFGGETLQDFAFAMVIGLIIGCYSSIAVGTPLFAMWKNREPKFAKLYAKYGPTIGNFDFQRTGAGMAGSLGNSKAARLKTARAKAADAEAALGGIEIEIAAEGDDGEGIIDTMVISGGGSNALGADGKPLYQQTVHNPNKVKRKKKK